MKKPGFIDIQVNGYLGIDFSDINLTENDVLQAVDELAKRGTAAICPTIVTCAPEIYEHNLPIIARAAKQSDQKRILGIHLEGPFISPEEGARGAHPPQFILPPSIEMFDRFMDLAEGMISILTLAPETEGAIDLIRHASSQGVVCSAGHHIADKDTMAAAVSAGASLYTHLGNGMPSMIKRHDNPLWWALACDDLSGSFITDGHHLPEDFLTVALRAKPRNRFIVISDSTSIAGLPPGTYDSLNAKVELSESGRISLAGTPYLAGSSANMLQCMNHLASFSGLCEDELWDVGFNNPLKLIGKDTWADSYSGEFTVEFANKTFKVGQASK